MNINHPVLNPTSRVKLYQFFEEYGTVSMYARNELIWGGNNKRSNDVYYIKYGYVKVATPDTSNEDPIYVVYGRGDLFSLLALVDKDTSSLEYTALNRVKVYAVPVTVFQENIAKHPEVAYGALQYMLTNSVLYGGAVVNLHYKKVSERLINGLLSLAARFGRTHENCIILDKVFNHRLIAAQINSTRESVSRELDKLRKKGLIETDSRQIVLKDMEGLYAELDKPFAPEFKDVITEIGNI